MIKAIAASGGLVGMVAVAGYVSPDAATLSRWVDHFDHVANLIGVDHLGLGLRLLHRDHGHEHLRRCSGVGTSGGMVALDFAEMATYRDARTSGGTPAARLHG